MIRTHFFSGSTSAGLIRSTSVPSVSGMGEDGEFRSSSRGSGIDSVLDSHIGRKDVTSGIHVSTGNLYVGRTETPNQDEQVSTHRTNIFFKYMISKMLNSYYASISL